MSFHVKNGQKRLISGEKHPSRSMSFRPKTTNPRTCHSGRRPGIQGRSRHSGFLLARNIARYFFSFFTRPENPISSSEYLKPVIPKACHSGQKTAKSVSFPAKNNNPGMCHSWPRPGIQPASVPLCLCAFVPFPCVILGPDPESSLPLCLCAFVPFLAQTRNPGALKTFRIPAFAEYCLVFLQFLHST